MTLVIQIIRDILDALPSGDEVFQFYAKNMRGGVFSGFLTLSGFLFSVNTFIIVNMKKELYDQEAYLLRFEKQLAYDPARTLYGPLKKLSRLLLLSVTSAVVTSIVQFTIGLVPRWYTAVFCLLTAIAAVVFLVKVLWEIRKNLVEMFDFLDKEAVEKIKKRKEKAAAKPAA